MSDLCRTSHIECDASVEGVEIFIEGCVSPLSHKKGVVHSVEAIVSVDKVVAGSATGRPADMPVFKSAIRARGCQKSLLNIMLVGSETYRCKKRQRKNSVGKVCFGAATIAWADALQRKICDLSLESVDGREATGVLRLHVTPLVEVPPPLGSKVTTAEIVGSSAMPHRVAPRILWPSRARSKSLWIRSAQVTMEEGCAEVKKGAEETLNALKDVDLAFYKLQDLYEILGSLTYIDLDFPPIRKTEWKQPSDVWKDPAPVLFRNGIEPDDVEQGDNENCWLMSALGAVAEFPHLIEHLFDMDAYNKKRCGLYRVSLCHGGQWRSVVIDDFFPFKNGNFVNARSKEHELWPLLLEKAMAKLCGGYERLSMGFAHDALIDLTGAPAIRYRIDKDIQKSELFEFLKVADDFDLIMSASTGVDDDDQHRELGLVTSHAYSLLSVAPLSIGDEAYGIVQLRNPFKAVEWKGKLCDDDPCWKDKHTREQLAKFLKRDPNDLNFVENDGSFWMPFNLFFRHFKHISICLPHVPQSKEPWHECRRRASFQLPREPEGIFVAAIYKLKLEKQSMAFVMAHQPDRRAQGAPSEFSDLAITIFRCVSSQRLDVEYQFFDATSPALQRQIVCPKIATSKYELIKNTWHPGQYVVVVWSALCRGLHEPRDDDDGEASKWPQDNDATWLTRNAVKEIFDRYDSGLKGHLTEANMDSLRKDLGDLDFDLEIDKVTESDLRTWLLTRPDKWRYFRKLGYEPVACNSAPVLTTKIPVVVSVHSKEPATLERFQAERSHIEYLLHRVQTEMDDARANKRNQKLNSAPGSIVVHESPGGCGVSLIACNFSEEVPISVSVDARGSVNLSARSDDGSLVVTDQVLEPLQSKALLHLAPSDPTKVSEVRFAEDSKKLKPLPRLSAIIDIDHRTGKFSWHNFNTLEVAKTCWQSDIEPHIRQTWIAPIRSRKFGGRYVKAAVLFVKGYGGPTKFEIIKKAGSLQHISDIEEEFKKRHPSARFIKQQENGPRVQRPSDDNFMALFEV